MIELRLDYATFNFEAGKMNEFEVARRLLGETDIGFRRIGRNENSPLYSPLGLRWQANNGYADMPHKLQVSGVGCEKFAPTLPALRENSRFSRLDFAFDVILERKAWRDFIVKCFAASMDSDRKYKVFRLTGTGEEMTIYIGSRSCAKFFRIYNKTLQDPKYRFFDGENEVEVDDDHCVIRYEVELHRFKDSKHLYDPSPMFDWYYSNESDKQQLLIDTVKDLWRDYGNEILLPADFESTDWTLRIQQNNKFCSKEGRAPVEIVNEQLHEYPRTFEHTLQFVVERYGKYLPYILSDAEYRARCFAACEREFGFGPEIYVEVMNPVFVELDDLVEPDFTPFIGDQLQVEDFIQKGGGSEWS